MTPHASRILPRLYQGPHAPPTRGITQGFSLVVLCAEELQPESAYYRGVRVLRCPLRDDFDERLPADALMRALDAAALVRAEHARGGRVYVSCAAGINRSGLVMALTVRQIIRVGGVEAIRWVQERRPGSLTNPEFRRALVQLGPPGQAPVMRL